MQPTREQLIRDIATARTRASLEKACADLQQHYPTNTERANPEELAIAVSKIVCAVNAQVGAVFPLPLSMHLVALMRQSVNHAGSYMLVGAEAWTKLTADKQFMSLTDHFTRLSSVMAGRFGVMYGMEIYTDAYYLPEMRSLASNSLTIMAPDGTSGLTITLA